METTTDLIFQFDELVRCYSVLADSTCEKEFLRFASNQELLRLKWVETTDECKRLKDKLDTAIKDISVLDGKLNSARRWLDAERMQRKKVELERDAFMNQLEDVRRILLTDPRSKLSDETKQKLSFLNGGVPEFNGNRYETDRDHLNAIIESDSVASVVSDISFSRSDNDLDDMPKTRAERKKHRLFFEDDEPATVKKRKSVETYRYFTPSAPRIESAYSSESDGIPPETKVTPREEKCAYSAMEQIKTKTHVFVSKTLIVPESCLWCSKKIRFGRMFLKCVDCNTIAHTECRDKVALPCAPMGTPTKKGGAGTIAEYAPTVPPMIPSIVIRCINEVERRGLTEVGIYRISGTEAVVRGLREKFLKHKGVLNLTNVDIHSVCSCLKDFLRNLQDSLIPHAQWKTFADAISATDKQSKLLEAISALPQANCDTLAFLILHLQNVASSPNCKMSVSNLAAVFGPTIVGYSNEEQANALTEVHTSNAIMEALLSLPKDYWNHFIAKPSISYQTPTNIRSTPSVESLSRKARKIGTTPGGKKKFFEYSPTLEKKIFDN